VTINITDEDIRAARGYAEQSLGDTIDRMGYGRGSDADRRRLNRIFLGKVVESAVQRHLQEDHGLLLETDPVATPYDEPDRADWLLRLPDRGAHRIDMKSFHVFPQYQGQVRSCEVVAQNGSALVPKDQFDGHPKDIYMFAFYIGDLRFDEDGLPSDVTDRTGVCDLYWESKDGVKNWEEISQGSAIFPYNRTRTTNYGAMFRNLRGIGEYVTQVRPGQV
jgi:hypothetical protein